jgi:hypothetical protein
MKPIEEIIIEYLGNILTVPVSADVPKDRPVSFVTVEQTGGSKEGISIDSATVAVQSWSKTRYHAASLADAVDKEMLSFAQESVILKVIRNSKYNFPDPDGKQARYQGVYDITYHNEY